MASHLTIPLDFWHQLSCVACPPLSLSPPFPLTRFSASDIKNILVVSRRLLTSFLHHRPAITHGAPHPPIRHFHRSFIPAPSIPLLFFPPSVLPPRAPPHPCAFHMWYHFSNESHIWKPPISPASLLDLLLWLCEGWWLVDFGLISLWWKH